MACHYYKEEQQEVLPSVSRPLCSVNLCLHFSCGKLYPKVQQQLAAKSVSPSRKVLHLRIVLEPPAQTCRECHIIESSIRGILYLIFMKYSRDREICNIRN